jgi:hypothetical protein
MGTIWLAGAAMSALDSEKIFALLSFFDTPAETRTPDPLITNRIC